MTNSFVGHDRRAFFLVTRGPAHLIQINEQIAP
jgi:hypothetical protein